MFFSTPARLRAALKSSASFNWSKVAASGLMLAGIATSAQANPVGATVTTGAASISSPSSRQTTVDQKSQGVVIDWSSFNIGNGQTTTFVQPSAEAIAVNRIGGASASQIFGSLDANGRVVLINGNGVLFGKTSQVNVGSLIATSSGGSDSDVLSGKFTQAGSRNASVVNQGHIGASQGGLVALVAPNVSNSGTVSAKLGTVALGGANAFTVDFAGDGLVAFAAQGVGPAKVANTGYLTGANVSLTARAAEGLATGVVAMSGTIVAQAAHNVGGTIILDAGDGGDVIVSNAKLDASGAADGGTIQVGGWNQNSVTVDRASVLNASATTAGNGGNISVIASGMSFQGQALAQGGSQSGHGGTIETSGHVIDVSGAKINTLGAHGAMGLWTLDPENVTISSAATSNGSISSGVFTPSGDNSNLSVTDLETALGTTSVAVTTGSTGSQTGDITVVAPIAWSANTLTLDAYHSIYIDAAMTATGAAGLAFKTDDGGTDGGYFFNGGNVTFANTSEALSINGQAYTLLGSMSDVQGINAGTSSLQGDYALANSLDATGITNWVPIGASSNGTPENSGNGFTGVFEGLGNTISNLTISLNENQYVGLFGLSSGALRDIGMVGGSINGNGYVGELVGFNVGTVSNAYATGSVIGLVEVGGLVGNNPGTIANSYALGTVTGAYDAEGLGGLTGASGGTISNSYATGSVSGANDVGGLVGQAGGTIVNTYATGTVSGDESVGGLAGELAHGTISDSFAGGEVNAATGAAAGGLVGANYSTGTIANDDATGAVIGHNEVGGLVGYNQSTIANSYATGSVTETSVVAVGGTLGGLVGDNTSTGTIDESYSIGVVTSGAGAIAGAFVGENDNTSGVGTTTADYFNSAGGAGFGTGAGTSNVHGLTTAQLETASSFSGWTFGTTGGGAGWVIADSDGTLNNAAGATGASSPMLLTEYSTTITNAHQLQLIALNLGANYTLANNIDATATGAGTDVWGAGGFAALGGNEVGTVFSGDLNGENHIINGLTVDNTTQSEAGLFGTFGGTVENLGLTNVNIQSSKGTPENSDEPGLGALAGMSYGTITNVYATGTVTATQADDNNTDVGGLVGFLDFGTLSNSHTAVNVTAGAGSGVGGMVGADFFGGVIENSYSTGTVTGGDNALVGGLIGFIYETTTISDDFASGNVTGGNSADAGGLIGEAFAGTISNAFATGNVSGMGNGEYGGFIGNNNGAITQSYATGAVSKLGTATGGNFAGFAGGQDEYGTMAQVYSTGSVTVDNTATAGGFIGSNGGAINEAYSKGIVTGGKANDFGAFAGMNVDAGIIGNTTEAYYETTGNTGLPAIGTSTGGSVNVGGIGDMTNPANFTAWTDFGGHGSGQTWVTIGASGDLNESGGTTPMLLSEYSTTIFSAHQLQLMELDPSATYTLNNNINAGGTAGGDVWGSNGFIPVGGNDAPAFSGNFNGQNYTISGLTIDAPSLSSVGLFGVSVGSIANVALTNANITGGNYEAAALVGENDGAVIGSSASGTLSSPGTYVGGLVGWNSDMMSSDSANVAVTGTGFGNAGGLAGENSGSVSQSSASGAVTTTYDQVSSGAIVGGLVGQNDEGTIATSWSSGAVTGTNVLAGGLVGDNLSTGASIADSYSVGSVVAGGSSFAGGLVGYNETDGKIARSWSAGYVSNPGGSSGGLVGVDYSTNGITNSYFDTESSGAGANHGAGNVLGDAGITGETSALLMGTLPGGFSNTTWGSGSGLFPYLLWQFPSGTPQAISGLVTNNGSTVTGLAVNGVSVDGSAASPEISMSSGANGFYYLLFAPGTIAGGSDVLTYATGSGATLSENVAGSLTGVNLVANTLLEPTSDTEYSTLAGNLATAIGSNTAAQSFVNDLSVQDIQISASSFAIDQTIDASTLILSTIGTVTQSAAITATNLDVLGGDGYILTNGANEIGTLAANTDVVSLADAESLVVGGVGGTNGIMASGRVTLDSSGTITQTAGIDAASLTGSSVGGSVLNSANGISVIAGFTNTGTGGFALTDNVILTTTGTINSGSGTLALTTIGTNHSLIVNNLTSGSTVDLVSGTGISGLGIITAVTLTGSSVGGTDLSYDNKISDLGTFTNTGPNGFSLTDARSLIVEGAVNAGSGALELITTGAGDDISVDAALTATSTVDLASAGTLTQSNAGIVTANQLTGFSSGGTTLNDANQFSDLGAFTNTGAGGIAVTDGKSLIVLGLVNAGTGNLTLTTMGAGSNISLDKAISTGATVDLISGGTITQTGLGTITATTLTGSSSGGATLAKSNQITDLGAFSNTGAGGFSLDDTSALTVNGVVGAGTGNLTLTTLGSNNSIVIDRAVTAGGTADFVSTGSISQDNAGVVTAATLIGSDTGTTTLKAANQIANLGALTDTGGDISLTDDHNLTITGLVKDGVHLVALVDTGTIAESTGAIDAKSMDGSSAGGATFNGSNLIGNLYGFTNTGAGGFALTNGERLVVGNTVNAGTGNLSLTTTGSGNISITKAISAGGSVDLVAAHGIDQTTTGAITAQTLTGSAGTTTVLNSDNQIANLGPFTNTGGNFSLTDTEALAVTGTVNVGTKVLTLQTTFGNLDVNAALDGKIVTLGSAQGEVMGTGAITAHVLNVTADTGIDLTGANDIGALGTDQTNSGPNVIDGVQ